MKCNYCYKKPSIVVKTKHETVNFDMYLCNVHSRKEIIYLNSKYKNEAGDPCSYQIKNKNYYQHIKID